MSAIILNVAEESFPVGFTARRLTARADNCSRDIFSPGLKSGVMEKTVPLHNPPLQWREQRYTPLTAARETNRDGSWMERDVLPYEKPLKRLRCRHRIKRYLKSNGVKRSGTTAERRDAVPPCIYLFNAVFKIGNITLANPFFGNRRSPNRLPDEEFNRYAVGGVLLSFFFRVFHARL